MKTHVLRLLSCLFLTGILTLMSCGAPRQASESSDSDTHNLGITKVDKRSVTTSVTTVDRDQVMDNSATSIIDMLRRVPGVVVGGGNSITIRGITSFSSSNEPLFVVDGVVVGEGYQAVSSMNPNDVNRISVLKGPSASLYGARAANGVIVIETKDGKPERKTKN